MGNTIPCEFEMDEFFVKYNTFKCIKKRKRRFGHTIIIGQEWLIPIIISCMAIKDMMINKVNWTNDDRMNFETI